MILMKLCFQTYLECNNAIGGSTTDEHFFLENQTQQVQEITALD